MTERRGLTRILASILCVCFILVSWGCSSSESSSNNSDTSFVTNVALFTPTDPLVVTMDRTVNSWNEFYTDMQSDLLVQGFTKSRISHTQSTSLSRQAEAISDYMQTLKQSEKSSSAADRAKPILLVAPISENRKLFSDYGAYLSVSQRSEPEGAAQMRASLESARAQGATIIILGQKIAGFQPDLYAPLVTAYRIGQVQAEQLVRKLKLRQTTIDHPQSIEILLPLLRNTVFTQELFRGIWDVLGPYFKKGKVYSPSGLLNSSSSAADWRNVTVDTDSKGSVAQSLETRLNPGNKKTHTRIRGVLAVNDRMAEEVISSLTDMGYTGTSATINPQISVTGVVNNLSGGTTLKRKKVPDPDESSSGISQQHSSSDGSRYQAADYPQWPIITGFGSRLSELTNIVNGKQWSTAFVNRRLYCRDLSRISLLIARKNSMKTIAETTKRVSIDRKASTAKNTYVLLTEQLQSVSASNIKSVLIDSGLIKATDAGL